MKALSNWLVFGIIGICSAITTVVIVRRLVDASDVGTPVALVPTLIELGEHEHGKTIVGRIRVANVGIGDLTLEQFATSCSCAAIEVESAGMAQRAGTIRVPPKDYVDLITRIAVVNRLGTSQRVYVSFATNDPVMKQPTVELVVGRVGGGVITSPLAVVFGEQRVGSEISRRIRVYDNIIKGRRIATIRSLNPDRFRVTLLPSSSDAGKEPDDFKGMLIGIIEVVPVTGRPGLLDGRIEIQLAEELRGPDYIEVIGLVVSPIITVPDALVLPRFASGKSLYEGRINVCSGDGKPIQIKPASAPADWSVTVVANPDTPSGQTVLVSRTSSSPPVEGRFGVRLMVSLAGGDVSVIDIPVFTRRDEP